MLQATSPMRTSKDILGCIEKFINLKLDSIFSIYKEKNFLWRKNKIDTYRVLTLGIKKKFRKLGIDAYMYYETYKKFIEQGIKWCEMSWMLEDNIDILEPMFKLGGTIYKRHRIYEKKFLP